MGTEVASVRRYVLEQDPGISAGYATGGLREQGLHILVISLFIGHFLLIICYVIYSTSCALQELITGETV